MTKWKPLTESHCVLKWSWNTLNFHDQITSKTCCRIEPHVVDPEDFDNFHDMDVWVNDRQQMLEGKWPAGCAYCSVPEKAGIISERIIHNDMDHIIPGSFHTDPLSTKGDINTLELFFSNLCNMSCIYCLPKFSSRWQSELEQHGPIPGTRLQQYRKTPGYDSNQAIQKLWPWLEKNINRLKELHVLGGEPFLTRETSLLLDFIENHPNRKLNLTLVSNLNVPEKQLNLTASRLQNLVMDKKLASVKINASIDGFDKGIEFQRYGLDLGLFEKNMQQLLAMPALKLSIAYTATCLSIHSMPSLMEKIGEWQRKKKIGFSGGRVITTDTHIDFLDLDTLPRQVYLPVLERMYQMIQTHNLLGITARLQVIRSTCEKTCGDGNVEKMQQLKNYLDVLSERRNTDWKQYYPWLVEIFDEHLVH
jgi:organic radical activating enzyme